MRSFQQITALLFAFLALALAQAAEPSYDGTVYVTSTIYRVDTVTLSGTPTGSVANSTSTISASVATFVPSYSAGNGTAAASTGVAPTSSAPASEFTGAASRLNANAFIAAVAAGVGYIAL